MIIIVSIYGGFIMVKKDSVRFKPYQIILVASLVMMLLGTFMASMIQSAFGRIKVQEIKIATDTGHISALLLIPPNATKENPAPLIITSHGSYNNKEIQDQNYTEWARRGFVVIAMDAYRHGSSSLGGPYDTMIDVVEYAYHGLNYIDKTKIGITGHSMGGRITDAAFQYYLAQEALGLGPNKISSALFVGFDGPYADYQIQGVDKPVFPSANLGIIAGKYDEWFYRSPDVNNNPLRYMESNNARAFVNQGGANVSGKVESGKMYWGSYNGKPLLRVIWQPVEIHPKNHFSSASAAAGSRFFYETLGTPNGAAYIDPASQVWQLKEFFNLLGLIGAFLFLYPFACLLMELPVFAGLKAEQPPVRLPALETRKDHAVFWGTYAVNLIIPALLVIPIAFRLIGKASYIPSTVNRWFGEPNTNELAGWTLSVAICLFAVFMVSTFLFNKDRDRSQIIGWWGVKITAADFFKSLLLGLAVVTVLYIIVFFLHFFFLADFRIWMIAIKTFTLDKVMYALAYVPAFIAFYLVNSILVNGGNNRENFPNWAVTLISCISNIAGIAFLIFLQYATLLSQGRFLFNSMRIVNLFPLIVLIPAATIVTRYFFRKTGKPYIGAIVIGILYTMFTCANTMFMASILS
jgi:hypothetical protein